MSDVQLAIAEFRGRAPADETPLKVHFNPATLQYAVTNTMGPATTGATSRQHVTQSVAKLTMDLVFDTTLADERVGVQGGEDVRAFTERLARYMLPFGSAEERTPAVVAFSWGAYEFAGTLEQYSETLELFSADGVPLRSAIKLTLSQDAPTFESSRNPSSSADAPAGNAPVEVPGGAGPAAVASQGGDPRAARALASANGSASLRFGGGASLRVDAGVSLGAAASFAAGGGAGISLGIGGGVGAGAGLGIEATAGAAFAGLRATAALKPPSLSAKALLPGPAGAGAGAGASVGASAGFSAGGMAGAGGSGSLSADVGAKARIGFDD
jgi:hypothetical protein